MASQAWEQAKMDLEIAAFGFLDKEELLTEAYVRLALTCQALGDEQATEEFLRDANLLLKENPERPPGLGPQFWDAFLILSGRKAPPRPPVPTGENALTRYLQTYPDSGEAWTALIDLQLTTARKSKMRQTIADAIDAVPENADVLNRALRFSAIQDGGRNAEDYAAKLLLLRPNSSVANEFLGGLAVTRKQWQKAASHFSLMTTAQLPKTPDYQRTLTKALTKLESRAEEQNPGKETNPPDELAEEDSSANEAEIQPLEADNPELTTTDEPMGADEPVAAVDTDEAAVSEPTLDERISNLERLARTNPSNPEYRFDLGDAYLRNGEIRKAKRTLARLAKSHKNHPRYAEVYAHYQYVQGNYQVNIDNLSGFIKPQGGIAYYLGMSYYRSGDLERARTYLKDLDPAEFIIPQDVSANQSGDAGIGGVQLDKTPTSLSQEEALEWLANQAGRENWGDVGQAMGGIIARYPTNPDIRYYQGRMLMSKGDYQDAMSIFIELVSQGYGENEIFYYAGVSALKRGSPSVAQYLFEKAQANNTRFKAEIENLLRDKNLKN